MRLQRLNGNARTGVAAVEMALCLPFLMILLFGVWEYGRLINIQQILSNATREGGRQVSLGTSSTATAQSAVTNYLQNAGVPTQNATVTITNVTEPGVDAAAATQMDQFTVTVTVPTKDFSWVLIGYLIPNGSNLTVTSTWYSMQNKTYPNPGDPPINY